MSLEKSTEDLSNDLTALKELGTELGQVTRSYEEKEKYLAALRSVFGIGLLSPNIKTKVEAVRTLGHYSSLQPDWQKGNAVPAVETQNEAITSMLGILLTARWNRELGLAVVNGLKGSLGVTGHDGGNNHQAAILDITVAGFNSPIKAVKQAAMEALSGYSQTKVEGWVPNGPGGYTAYPKVQEFSKKLIPVLGLSK